MCYGAAMNDYRDCIGFLLAKASQRVSGVFKARLRPYGLTPVQNLILSALREEDGVPVGEIGRKLALDTATLTGTLDRMAQAGWVEKRPDPEDGRVVRVWMTERAREAGAALQREIQEINAEVLAPFTLEERIVLKRLLREFQAEHARTAEASSG